jgi:hypothetical protein
MEIRRSGSQPSGKGPAEYFTGSVRIDPVFGPPEPARVAMALVTFEPGARTACYRSLKSQLYSWFHKPEKFHFLLKSMIFLLQLSLFTPIPR